MTIKDKIILGLKWVGIGVCSYLLCGNNINSWISLVANLILFFTIFCILKS